MAKAIINFDVRATSPEVNMEELEKKLKEIIESKDGVVNESKVVPFSFGLKSVNINFSIDESHGVDSLEDEMNALDDVNEVVTLSMSRALG